MRRTGAAASMLFAALAGPAWSEGPAPVLALPLACTPGETCFVQSYVDADPAKGSARDYACGSLTYDGHDGTDFRILSRATPVTVLAAAAGTVLRVRDGDLDRSVAETGREAVAGRECGNGLVIDHGGGWTSQYCHMAQGSLQVAQGERVRAGAPLGQVGLSGLTEFPHLHFTLRQGDKVIDPFARDAARGSCGGGTSMWNPAAREALAYRTRAILNAGFAGAPVTHPLLDQGLGQNDAPTPASDAVIAYVRAIGLRRGDVQHLELRAPSGDIISQTRSEPLPRDQAQVLLYVGRKRPAQGFPPGDYLARYAVWHEGALVLERDVRFRLATPAPVGGDTSPRGVRHAQ